MAYATIEAVPLVGALGAEIRGVDLAKPLDDATFADVHQAFLDYQVLCFRDQHITPAQQLAFAARFGEIDTYPFMEPLPDHPGVIPIVKEPETRHNFGGGWHTDTSYMARPPMATLLYALDVPERGGDTMFADMYGAYESLSDGMKKLLDGTRAVFTASAVHGAGGIYRQVRAGDGPRREDDTAAEARHEHPVIRTHPETGRKGIYVGKFHVERLVGMSVPESRPLIDFLAERAVEPQFTTRLQWRAGTLVMWDNRCVQHYALNDYPGKRREMHRITIKGDVPF